MHVVDRTDEFRALAAQHNRLRVPLIDKRAADSPLLSRRHQNLQRALDALSEPSVQLPRPQALRVALAECTLARENANNDQQRRHWCEVERLLRQRHRQQQSASVPASRLGGMSAIERQLHTISTLYSRVGELVARQSRPIGDIEQNIGAIEARVDASYDQLHDAAPRAYRTRQWRWYRQYVPQSLPARMRACLACMLCANLLVVYCLLAV